MTKVDCPHHTPEHPLLEPDLCKYWHPAGTDRFGGWYPGYCGHREVMVATCFAGRLWRADSDDDGEE